MNWQAIASVGLFLVISFAFKSGMFTGDAATDQTWPDSVEFAVGQDAVVSRINPQTAAADDQWRIYCAGRKSVSREIFNQIISEPAVFFAWRVHDSEVPEKVKAECYTDNLTTNFVTERLTGDKLKKATSTHLKTTMQIGQSSAIVSISFGGDDYDFEKELKAIEHYKKDCDSDDMPNESGIYYAYQKGQYCSLVSYRTSSKNRYFVVGYSVDQDSGDVASFVCLNRQEGLCTMTIGYQNRKFTFIFPQKFLPAWRGIREEVQKIIPERVVLNYKNGSCSGDLCDEIMQVLN